MPGSDYRAALAAAGVGYLPLSCGRFVPFDRTLVFEDVDYSGATFLGQVRLKPDASGSAVASFTVTPSFATPNTLVRLQIAEATMEAMPAAAEQGANLTLYWDLHVTPSGSSKQMMLAGEFTVLAGVTQ
jgi:hypothetical protein